MTKKDYELIAGAIANAGADSSEKYRLLEPRAAQYWYATELAYQLEETNPQFNRTKFLQACGIEEN